ncbi:acyl-CoA thioesterase [Paenibacillus elgii]|uniref:acyl-CoA thioesterase n=1 Tax=Paenibacillus elgii TaxID=189691 RepID=UPI000FD688F5|nr:thioesterase family protein [Paenibacillus elgii]MCM3273832.1 acyl-CoA thioesterase [Paenibacillus elgii]NEN83142.1 acyl-CoA thioesterase [Paenibacillus elgii]
MQYTLRVRYQETDQMGVVYHANYLNWFEVGRTEMIRELGLPYQALETRGLLLPVIEADLKFRSPARYDDLVTINTKIVELTSLRIRFAYEIKRGEELLVTGGTQHVWLNQDWKPVRIDRDVPDLYALLAKTMG